MLLTLGVGNTDRDGDSLGFALADVGAHIPEPGAVAGRHGSDGHVRGDLSMTISSCPIAMQELSETYYSGWRKP